MFSKWGPLSPPPCGLASGCALERRSDRETRQGRAEKALRMDMESKMNSPPNEMDLSCPQPRGRVPRMDHTIDKREMKHSASFSFIRT